jgi:serine protease 16
MTCLRNVGSSIAIAFVFWSMTVSAIPHFRPVSVLNGHKDLHDSASLGRAESSVNQDDVQELYLEQSLDHFSAQSDSSNNTNATFQQRYFYSARHAGLINRTNATVYAFLCVGGEGPSLDKSVLVDSVHCSGDMLELAKRLHAGQQAIVHLFALEHRYYGESYPEFRDKNGNTTSPVTNENLVYLSSRQALADLARFIETMNDKHGLHHRKWVTFGGSYPGMMAAFARLEYPKLVHAAVSNSAPVEMEVDFPAYNERVAFDLQYPLVGGSSECLQTVLDGHHDIVDAIAAGYHKEIAALFNVCDSDSLLNRKNVDLFVGDGVIGIPAQGNDPSCDKPICNIRKVCAFYLCYAIRVAVLCLDYNPCYL